MRCKEPASPLRGLDDETGESLTDALEGRHRTDSGRRSPQRLPCPIDVLTTSTHRLLFRPPRYSPLRLLRGICSRALTSHGGLLLYWKCGRAPGSKAQLATSKDLSAELATVRTASRMRRPDYSYRNASVTLIPAARRAGTSAPIMATPSVIKASTAIHAGPGIVPNGDPAPASSPM